MIHKICIWVMVIWTAVMAYAGIGAVADQLKVRQEPGGMIGLVIAVILDMTIWLIPVIGLSIIAFVTRPRKS